MEEIIKEIAELLDIQEVVFLHKKTHEILAYPIADGPTDEEFDYIEQEVMEVINADPDSYIRFDPLNSRESFQMMEDFVETIKNVRLRDRLIDALSIKKPFRSFRNAIQSEEIEDDWYAYKDAYLQMYVRDRL
ncbi:UPF0158 family protein [Haliscomenobacter sp.]|uniref:UPF0158 family protein n=1 Tax=Haliscomenobacter sp. TaxID=2717303 RepID=UPI0035941BC6